MAQRRVVPRGWAFGLAGLRIGMLSVPARWLRWSGQAEEARAGPGCTGDDFGDVRERAVALPLMLEAVLQHPDGVGPAAPGPDQGGPGPEPDSRRRPHL